MAGAPGQAAGARGRDRPLRQPSLAQRGLTPHPTRHPPDSPTGAGHSPPIPMEIKAQVRTIDKLRDYHFLVPDYQREYVWKVDDQVEQFLADIANEYEPGALEQRSYFIGSIIIVRNGSQYDVIDGQQRLTTTVLTMCALRDLLKSKSQELNAKQAQHFQGIDTWLSSFDLEADEVKVRLELQYEESRDYLARLIQGLPTPPDETASIQRMRA